MANSCEPGLSLNEEKSEICLEEEEIKPDTEEKDGADVHEVKKEIVEKSEEELRKEMEDQLSEEERQKRKEDSQQLKTEGNEHFKSGLYEDSVECYTNALKTCPLMFTSERAILHSNIAACHQHLDDKETAIENCCKALELNPEYLKARIRRAQLYDQTDKLDEALEDYQAILKQDPSHSEARAACNILPGRISERNEKMKTEMLGKLKDLGNLILRPFGLSTENFQMQQDPNSGGYSINFKQTQQQ